MSPPLLQVEARIFNHPGKVQCFLARILQKIRRRSAGNRGIIINTKNPETAKNSKYLSNLLTYLLTYSMVQSPS